MKLKHISAAALLAVALSLHTPPAAWAGTLTCLTGTDPSVATDAYQLALVRAAIGFGLTNCPCANFDGSAGKTHAAYSKCIKGDIDKIYSGSFRPQCKQTLLKQLKQTTCGVAPSSDPVPCVKKTLGTGKVTCAIKPRAQCVDKGKFTQVACTPLTGACVDAADTNGDGLIAAGDSGACAMPVCGNGVREGIEQCDPPGATCPAGEVCTKSCYCVAPTNTPVNTPVPGQPTNTPVPPPPPTKTPVPPPTNTPPPPGSTPTHTFTSTPRFVDNGDGTITDNQTGLMWEKKDQSGGLDDVNKNYPWAGVCSDGSGLCQPDFFAAELCATQTGGAEGCFTSCASPATCDTRGLGTIWDWLAHLRIAGLGGHSDWRIPIVGEDGGTAELETIVDTSVSGCSSGSSLCVPAAFDTGCTSGCNATGCSCTFAAGHWSATTYTANPQSAWGVSFYAGQVYNDDKGIYNGYVRAVR
ncbi:MAG: DUF1566 domain-containing protein [Candidatus Binatia bacterium]